MSDRYHYSYADERDAILKRLSVLEERFEELKDQVHDHVMAVPHAESQS